MFLLLYQIEMVLLAFEELFEHPDMGEKLLVVKVFGADGAFSHAGVALDAYTADGGEVIEAYAAHGTGGGAAAAGNTFVGVGEGLCLEKYRRGHIFLEGPVIRRDGSFPVNFHRDGICDGFSGSLAAKVGKGLEVLRSGSQSRSILTAFRAQMPGSSEGRRCTARLVRRPGSYVTGRA